MIFVKTDQNLKRKTFFFFLQKVKMTFLFVKSA